MSINLTKRRIIDLTKKVSFIINKHELDNIKSQVVLVLDISKSMNKLYKSGVVQSIIEKVLPLALKFDDDGKVDIILFGTRAYQLPSVSISEIHGYVERVIIPNYKIIEATKYSTAIKIIYDIYQGNKKYPVFVVFVTDGNNSDKLETTSLIRMISFEPIFFQFIGIGKEQFVYLNKLDNLTNRFIDNAGFMHVNDIETINTIELYDRLLNEFPTWLIKAKEKSMIL